MNGNNPDFTITKVVDSSSYDAQRGSHRTKQVHFKTADGTATYVEVPLDQFSPDTVHQMVSQAVDTHKQIMSLQPGQPPQSGGPFG